jgi:mono/diheme cytochrome c family protein
MKIVRCLSFLILAVCVPTGLNAQPVPVVPPPPPQPILHQAVTPPPIAMPQPPVASLDSLLAWDANNKTAAVTAGTPEAHFTFNITNISATVPVTVNSAVGSCGCTVARLPYQPWVLGPGTNVELNVTMNLAGKSGTVVKTVTISTDKGVKQVTVTVSILPGAAPSQMDSGAREQNQKLAIADRQAVFKGDCARCHAVPAANKMGPDLFKSVCGVCHEAEHRATMVPDLHAIKEPTNAEFWKNWITQGKPGSLMPAFAQSQGGILTDEQIASLVAYLVETIPSVPPPPQQLHFSN